jgi:hypothetical protein
MERIEELDVEAIRGWCKTGEYNPLASIFWAAEGEIITNLIASTIETSLQDVLIFFSIWYFFTCITYGTNVPAGLFLPGMIFGCCLGHLMVFAYKELNIIDANEIENNLKNFVVLGAASALAGYTRMTFSLAVIMMETSQTINLFVPIFFTVLISNIVGNFFTRGLYARAVRGKQMPILQDWIPKSNLSIMAEMMMNENVVMLQRVEKLGNIAEALNTTHHSFPVVNKAGNLIGMIPKNFIIVIIKQRGFYFNEDNEINSMAQGLERVKTLDSKVTDLI